MRVTQEADYAMRLTHILSLDREATRGAMSLSAEAGVPERYTLKILSKLRTAGLVDSVKGVHGGYRLAKAPAEISMLNVLCAIDGDVMLTKCLAGAACTRMGNRKDDCLFRCVYNHIGQGVRRRLSSVSMQDVLDGTIDFEGLM